MDADVQDPGGRLRKCRDRHSRRALLYQSGNHRDRNRKGRASLSGLDRIRHRRRVDGFGGPWLDIAALAWQKPENTRPESRNMPDLETLQAHILEQIAA